MTYKDSSIEYILAEKFFSEHVKSASVEDVPGTLSLISEVLYDKKLYDTAITKRHVTFVKKFFSLIQKYSNNLDMSIFVAHSKKLYDVYNSSVEVYISTDVLYDEATKKIIGQMCQNICNVGGYTMVEKITLNHGGGFTARFKDYRIDASYSRDLHTL